MAGLSARTGAGPLRVPAGRRARPLERLRLAAEIVAAYLTARRKLRSLPIEAVVAALRDSPSAGTTTSATGAAIEAQRLGRAVARTLRLVPGDTRCLTRSLVLTLLLARRGVGSTLVIGARTAPSFLAHAWVEHEGRPVLDPGDGSFARLTEI